MVNKLQTFNQTTGYRGQIFQISPQEQNPRHDPSPSAIHLEKQKVGSSSFGCPFSLSRHQRMPANQHSCKINHRANKSAKHEEAPRTEMALQIKSILSYSWGGGGDKRNLALQSDRNIHRQLQI